MIQHKSKVPRKKSRKGSRKGTRKGTRKTSRKGTRKGTRKTSRKGTRKGARKTSRKGTRKAFMMDNKLESIDINKIREKYLDTVSKITKLEKKVDKNLIIILLEEDEDLQGEEDEEDEEDEDENEEEDEEDEEEDEEEDVQDDETKNITKNIINCAKNYDYDVTKCINEKRELKEMRSIIKTSKRPEDIEKKLVKRKELRKERIFQLLYLTKISCTESELSEKIKKIVKETGGLQLELHFDIDEYKKLLGSKIINLYKKYIKSLSLLAFAQTNF